MTRIELRLAVRRYLTDVDNAEQDALNQAAARQNALDAYDAALARCGRCGSWRLGRCTTPFCR